MRDIVWVWLSTCIGVVEGDSNPVEAYLNSGGDPTQKLSHPETQLLPRPGPGVYDADHQLQGMLLKWSTSKYVAEACKLHY